MALSSSDYNSFLLKVSFFQRELYTWEQTGFELRKKAVELEEMGAELQFKQLEKELEECKQK
jgi:hypothetical protein